MRRLLIAGNWKMHGSLKMTSELISGIAENIALMSTQQADFDCLVCPPSVYLASAQLALAGTSIKLGAQDVSAHACGAYTGELALSMLAEFNCNYVLLGHSERRTLFDETDQQVAQKFAACVASDTGVIPVLCIGETLEHRQSGATEAVIDEQLDAVLAVTEIASFANAVIAYEPVWAIGTGETASPEQAQQVHSYIRTKLAALDSEVAAKLQILYGGTMKPGNAAELLAQADIDGGLIGGAALNVESFSGICKAAAELSNRH
jgi:triosephosphate isomerase